MNPEPGQSYLKQAAKAGGFPFKTNQYNTHYMKKSLITMMAAALMSASAFAGEATTDSFVTQPSQDFKRLSGAVHVGAGTAYSLHGYVPTTEVVQGEGYGMGAIQLAYDFGKESFWSYVGGISYKAPFSGHTLYGAPGVVTPDAFLNGFNSTVQSNGLPAYGWTENTNPILGYGGATPEQIYNGGGKYSSPMPRKNIENEFIIRNGLKYTRELWNTSFGYDYIHGGIAGVVAKHFDQEAESRMQQVWINGEITPVAWFSADLNIARTFDTVDGWWFEAHARFKAPIVGSPEDIKVAGILEFGISATQEFYSYYHNACDNGIQAYWVKLSTPWFVNEAKNFILTPSVSFNWLGRGGRQANKQSHAKAYGERYVPFRNFTVIGELTATYKF